MVTPELSAMRHEYASRGLDEATAGSDPFALFERWFAEAVAAGIGEPNAMALATATADGVPSVRTVLLKQFDRDGAVFHTHYDSRKGRELRENPRAAAVLLWHDLARQVRLEGPVAPLEAADSDAYFRTRPVGGRISAAASPQSQVVADRAELEQRWAAVAAAEPEPVRPPRWGGLRITIETFEFWQGRPDRLHDRLRFTRTAEDRWLRDRLAP